jgi:UDP-N-acetylglucosamine diphosphorylase/glucosamine-1-phosphate N-acetyltransferase
MQQIASIILAAGQGTRMKSEKPKVIHKIAGQPMILRVLEIAQRIDCQKICVVVGFKKEDVISLIPENEKIVFVEQQEQNGTGHAVMVTRKVFENFQGTIFILCGDVPLLRVATLKKMLNHHNQTKADCTVLTAVLKDPLAYGRIVRNSSGDITKIVEFKDATESEKDIREINTGIYCFDCRSLFLALDKIGNNNAQKEYYLTDTLEVLLQDGKHVTSVLLEDIVEASGVNSKEQLRELELEYLNHKDFYNGVR